MGGFFFFTQKQELGSQRKGRHLSYALLLRRDVRESCPSFPAQLFDLPIRVVKIPLLIPWSTSVLGKENVSGETSPSLFFLLSLLFG